MWYGFQAAHIVILAHEAVFLFGGFDSHVTHKDKVSSTTPPENGTLNRSDLENTSVKIFSRSTAMLLFWYFRQAVLANMLRVAEPPLEHES
ncbi:hypothetical protein ASPWEDRAFT_42924 [Aspergillus wentii DTO 134E9]|uniref:Uncharacterized protein n=1 Tax=Aspergillus wentii DTO 134E9 TaxID=1073089 RepID=A0A1L9RDA0_ASPWE|nr:uncharacterized protein ASPWEDRAFT_42924 [Aspergillus wentii DTO 134E9]OJJ32884.1 hypothetical protein ASPWEDRAFT_42924 [Aspergillus wentii DTO 134E9]